MNSPTCPRSLETSTLSPEILESKSVVCTLSCVGILTVLVLIQTGRREPVCVCRGVCVSVCVGVCVFCRGVCVLCRGVCRYRLGCPRCVLN